MPPLQMDGGHRRCKSVITPPGSRRFIEGDQLDGNGTQESALFQGLDAAFGVVARSFVGQGRRRRRHARERHREFRAEVYLAFELLESVAVMSQLARGRMFMDRTY